MKSIELTAYAVREYDVKYTVVFDENDPIIQEYLSERELTFEELATLDHHDYKDVWDFIMSLESHFDLKIDEDFGMGDERLIDYETFITENPLTNTPTI
jgi:hypothetical protein